VLSINNASTGIYYTFAGANIAGGIALLLKQPGASSYFVEVIVTYATDPTKKATVAYNTIVPVPSSVKVSSASSATNAKTVSYGKTFVGTPSVWVQMNSTSSFANSQIFPQVVSVGATSCDLLFRTSTANGTMKFTLFVTGQLA
jgi:hypothetical protein